MVVSETGQDFKLMQKSLDSLTSRVLDHWLALDYVLAEQGGIGAIANMSCCFSNVSGEVDQSLTSSSNRLHGYKILTAPLPKPPGSPLEGTYQMALGSCLSLDPYGPWVFNLLEKFVSSRL